MMPQSIRISYKGRADDEVEHVNGGVCQSEAGRGERSGERRAVVLQDHDEDVNLRFGVQVLE